MAYNDAIKIADITVQKAAEEIKVQFDSDMSISKTLANAFYSYRELPKDQWQNLINKMYSNVFKNNDQIYGLWDSWELSVVDSNWDKPFGRIANSFWRENGVIKNATEYRSLTGDSELYKETKSNLKPSISEPYFDIVTDTKTESLLMTSLNAPIVENGKYTAVVSIDITLAQIQDLIETIKPFDGSYTFLISNAGIISGHPETEMLNRNIAEVFPVDENIQNLTRKIREGKSFSYTTKNINDSEYYITYAPIVINETITPWSIAISVPVKTIMYKAIQNFRISILVGFIGLLVMIIVVYTISRNITNPISNITNLLNLLSKGHIDKKMVISINTGDEIEEMAYALNSSIEGLNKKVEFANHIGAGELNSNFELLSDDDVLGKSLIEMRNSLIKARTEEDKRKIEDEKRRWTNEGLAKFADILRQNNNDLNLLSTEIIKNLVYYIRANQGGIFIKNDQERGVIVLELLSAFAFDRQKYLKKQIQIGEGLVGTCALEKETIHITEIPQNYVQITSGLGGANPNSLILVPLLIENEIMGVIEIASFNKFEDHEVEFVEKVAESIASTLKSVRINIRTTQLLEQSQQQSEEMAAQEEEMRQNMEELQATQEESARRESEFKGVLEAVDHFLLKAEFSFSSDLLLANSLILQKLEYSLNDIKGLRVDSFFTEKDNDKIRKIWKNVMSGNTHQEIGQLKTKSGKLLKCVLSFNPVYIDDELEKILLLAVDMSDYK